eukprot:605765-Pyramimonas_sp.AAC.1
MKFIVDADCGSKLISVKSLQDAGMVDRVSPLAVPIALNAAGGQTGALGAIKIASDKLNKGEMEAIVMRETQCFPLGNRQSAAPTAATGKKVGTLSRGKDSLPYREWQRALGQVDEAAPAGSSGLERWARVETSARSSLGDPGTPGGPQPQALRHRATLELHSRV